MGELIGFSSDRRQRIVEILQSSQLPLKTVEIWTRLSLYAPITHVEDELKALQEMGWVRQTRDHRWELTKARRRLDGQRRIPTELLEQHKPPGR